MAQDVAPAVVSGVPTDPKKAAKPSRRSILMRIGLLLAILAVVFVVILPRVVDYGSVLDALELLTAGQLAALVAATVLAYIANAAPSRIMVPGLSWPHAIGADLAGRAVVSTIPGPTDIATRFVLYRQWAIPADAATAGLVFNAFFETLSDLVLPLIATVGILLAGHTVRPTVVVLSVASALVLLVAMLLIVGITRSESVARRIGGALQSLANHVWGFFHRPPPTEIADGVLQVRERAHDTLSRPCAP